jgi:hypothetical protein
MVWGRCGSALLVASLVAGCGGAAGTVSPPSAAGAGGTAPPSSVLATASDSRVVDAVISDTRGVAPTGFTIQDRLVTVAGRTFRLAYQPMDVLAAMLVPEAVPTFDGKTLYYTMWEGWRGLDGLTEGEVGGVPVIRRVDLASGVDEVFRRGAYAAAVAEDGRVAYVEDLDGAYRFSVPNPTRVMVTSSDGGADEVWSTEDDIRYVTVGWAGEVLVAYQVLEGEYVRTVAFYGPGRSRLLSEGGMVVAISPDGSKVLLIEQENWTHFVVEDVSDGAVLWSGELDTPLGPVNGIYGCDWDGDRIVVVPGAGDGSSYPYVFGFAILRFDDGALSLERFVVVPGETAGLRLISLMTPRFTTDGGVRLQASALDDKGKQWFWDMVCDPAAAACAPVTPRRDTYPAVAEVNNWSGGVQP